MVNRSLAYAVPALMDAGVDPPLLRLTMNGDDDETLPLAGVRALACCSAQGQALAGLDTCVVFAEGAQRVAGDCLTGGCRDGAPGDARFQRLTLLAAVPAAPFLFAVYDADAVRVAVGTPWGVQTAPVLYDNSAPAALSLLIDDDDAAWLLTLTAETGLVWLSRCVGGCALGRIGGWELADVFMAAAGGGALLAPAPPRIWVWTSDGYATRPLAAWGEPPVEGGEFLFGATSLAGDASGGLWGVDLATERSLPLDAVNATTTTAQACAVLCPPGTFAPACQRCPPGTFSDREGAVACAACPANATLQGPLARGCVATCPPWTHNCLECAVAGQQWQQGACRPCPPMTAAALGEACAPCAPGTAAPAGASACVPRNTDAACLPTGNASLAVSSEAAAWTAFSLARLDNDACCALAAARNGTLWCVFGGGVRRVLPDVQDLLLLPQLQCTLVLTGDEGALYAADSERVWRIVAAGVSSSSWAAPASLRELAGGLLFWRSDDGRIGSPATGVLDGLPPMALMDVVPPQQLLLLCATAEGVIGLVDPTLATFSPIYAPQMARSVEWLRALDAETAAVCVDACVIHLLRLPSGELLQTLGACGGVEDGLAPLFAAPRAPTVLAHGDGLQPMLLFVDGGGLRALWARGCECAPGFEIASGACVPSAGGCGFRQYRDATEGCVECPDGLWWRAPPTLACPLLWSSSSSDTTTRYTLAQAQALALARPQGVDAVYVPDAYQSAWGHATSPARADTLLLPDALGAFWSLRLVDAPPRPSYDPDNVSVLAAPALVAPFPPLPPMAALGFPGPPWNSARALAPEGVDASGGWPMRFDCVSPTHYWQYPSATFPRGACLPCAVGTLAWADDALACSSTNTTTLDCAPGLGLTILNLSAQVAACRPCPPGTFSSDQQRCVPKRTLACAPGEYVYDDGLGTADNVCVACEACDLRVPGDGNCSTGALRMQPYRCVTDHPPPGFFFSFADTTRWQPCGPLPPNAAWSQGPRVDLCYFRCRWGAQTDALQAYLQQQQGAAETWAAALAAGLIPYAATPQSEPVCFPDLSAAHACPDGYFWGLSGGNSSSSRRRLLQDDSSSQDTSSMATASMESDMLTTTSAEMATSSIESESSASESISTSILLPFTTTPTEITTSDGACTPLAELPAHAHPRVDGGWACDAGFFLLNASFCAPCAAQACGEGEWFRADACGGDVSGCYACPSRAPEAALAPGVRGGQCVYQCVPPAQARADGACFFDVTNATCPPGERADDADGCAACALAAGAMMVPAPSADSVCRGWCRDGYHTIDRASLRVVDDPTRPQDPSQVLCEPCVHRPSVPCPPAPSCSPAVSDCGAGAYACVGLCVRCPGPPPAALQMWVGVCEVACVRDAQLLMGPGCTPCSALRIPDGAPYVGYHATWNATPGVRWWPRAFDPPHLRPRRLAEEGEEEERAGVCWPCATHVRAGLWGADNGDPCETLPSPWQPQLPASTLDAGAQVRLHGGGQQRRRLLAAAYTYDRRRLAWNASFAVPRKKRTAMPPLACPRGWFADARPQQCVRCPRGTRGARDGTCRLLLLSPQTPPPPAAGECPHDALPRPFEAGLCACRPGAFYDASARRCRRCPPHTVSRTLSNAPCVNSSSLSSLL